MLFKALLLGACAAIAAAQSSVLTFTHVPNPVTDGQANAITYATNDTTTPVTIILRKGISTNLQNISTLTTDATNGQYIWTPPVSLPDGSDYALEIIQGTQTNYYGPFIIQGANLASVSAAAKSSTSSAASSTASSKVTTTTKTANSTSTATVTTSTKSGKSSKSSSGTSTSTVTSVASSSVTPSTTPTATTATVASTSSSSSTPTNGASELVGSAALSFGGLFAFLLL